MTGTDDEGGFHLSSIPSLSDRHPITPSGHHLHPGVLPLMIQTINVSLSYNNGVQALRNVSVRVEKGDFLFVVGSTGSGKSSFMKLLNREEVPTSGHVLVAGKDVGRMRPRHVPGLRRSVGVVFQ